MKTILSMLALLAAVWLLAAEPVEPIVLTVRFSLFGQVEKDGPHLMAGGMTIIALDENGSRLQTAGRKVTVPAPGKVRLLIASDSLAGQVVDHRAVRTDDVIVKLSPDDYPPKSAIWAEGKGGAAGKAVQVVAKKGSALRVVVTDPADCYFFRATTGGIPHPRGSRVSADKPYQVSLGEPVIIYNEKQASARCLTVVAVEGDLVLVELRNTAVGFVREVERR